VSDVPAPQPPTGAATTFAAELGTAAPWLQREWGQKFRYAYRLVLDAMAENVRLGVRARCPGAGPPDALAYVGRDRVIVRGPLESDDSYATRLAGAFDAWQRAGAYEGTMRQVSAFFLPVTVPVLEVNTRARWATLASYGAALAYAFGDPAAWNWDGDAGLPARAWVVLQPPPGTWDRGAWGDGVWGPERAWGFATTPPGEPTSVSAIVAAWKAAQTLARVIVSYAPGWPSPVAPPGPTYPDGTWGDDYVVVGGVAVSARYAEALYLAPIP